ncbi:hypothetical protein OAK35_03415 [Crocinitomicaceae bacterium]|nr:hypothetical protein [Crocinitomicaceae bacterium]
MKKLILSLVVIATIAISSFGQAPEGFKYQAVVRDAGNTIVNNQAVGMQMTIQQGSIGGTTVYQETFAPTTNAYGLVNHEIGSGTVVSGDFTTIDWSAGPYFIETAVDVTGGTSYAVMGTSQLMSVPYALYANTAENVTNDLVDDADADPTNEMNTGVVLNGTDLEVTDGNGTIVTDLSSLQDGVNDADADPTNEMNTGVVLNGTNLEVTDGNGTIVTDLSSLQDGVNDADADPTNEMNTGVVLNGTNLEVTDGNGTIVTDLSSLQYGVNGSSESNTYYIIFDTGTDFKVNAKPLYDDGILRFGWDAPGNDIEIMMLVTPTETPPSGGAWDNEGTASGDLVCTVFNIDATLPSVSTYITTKNTTYDILPSGLASLEMARGTISAAYSNAQPSSAPNYPTYSSSNDFTDDYGRSGGNKRYPIYNFIYHNCGTSLNSTLQITRIQ